MWLQAKKCRKYLAISLQSEEMAGETTPSLFVTANVGSIFEDVSAVEIDNDTKIHLVLCNLYSSQSLDITPSEHF